MKVLITGSSGLVGKVVVEQAKEAGYEVVSYDLADGKDILDASSLDLASQGCDVIVHLAAMDEPVESEIGPATTGTAEKIFEVNVQGTKNVLAAAEKNNVQKVVVLSSVDVFGVFMGKGVPDYLPLDDKHPLRPVGPYAESKVQVENLCEEFTKRTGVPTIILRPPGIFTESIYEFIRAMRVKNPEAEWSPIWEYGAFIDVRDVAGAVIMSVECHLQGHHRLLICADDISSAEYNSVTLVQKLLPNVEWRGGEEYANDPFRALLNTDLAKKFIGFSPKYKWRS